ncbi:DoxX family protein [Leptospira montravelensis]|uniref:DoxX family protein n=1 Tax=Leptospira montravelensis TaxID=2484961 RepID=A0ABY2LU38_9LEPT|nr:DoxX family membrane protein [Leptospira montravelensis]TGK78679.1 DoxX family protein [Leptospira montravelensis]TGL02383.1 DoxX family protein [Leptospira montravelensis]
MNPLDTFFRIVLGIIFILFGFSKFYAFMPTPPMTPAAANFIAAIISTGYLWNLVGIIEIIGGILVLYQKTTVTGLLILSPIVINIVLYLGFLQYSIGPAPFLMILFLLVSTCYLACKRLNQWKKLFLPN